MVSSVMWDGTEADTVKGTVSPHLTRLLVRAGLAAGLDRSRLAGVPDLGVLNQNGIRIPTATIMRVWELVSGPAWEAGGSKRVMELWRPGALGVWDYLFCVSGTLGHALDAASRHLTAIADPADRFLTVRDGDGVTVTYQGPYRDHPQYPLIGELVPHMLLVLASSATGRRLTPVRVRLPQRASTASQRVAELYNTTKVEFEADHPSITFAAADTDVSLPRADPALAAILEDHARLSTVAARPVWKWLDRFHAALESAVAEGPPGLDEVAGRLAMSPRTLQRRLREEGTTWRAELEELRQRRVQHLLRETSLSVDSIAARVGFTDSRSLRRAVHRWYGHGPAAIRASGSA
ncbi:transcriptional regulator [Planobispora rosea]|uniref:Transcriptional regulator n=1 Tax=Planobispora rosea TaxID=35762 RepID=A0A8J3WH84_PLARO|nr:AraC family transcriptional regulator [Planobispora rosea]GGS57732.1 transcriptional regulator [Planobispora rosea]GIH88502.1 transcriptional regulator [Planobispora rosea]